MLGRFKIFFLLVFLSLVASSAIDKFIELQTHSLAKINSWYEFKKLKSPYFRGLNGSRDFFFERQAVAGEVLNLGVWFGFHDVLYRKPLQLSESFRVHFTLPSSQAYLWIFLSCDREKCFAFRASANPLYVSGVFSLRHNGEFISMDKSADLLRTGEHSVGIASQGRNQTLTIDGEKKVLVEEVLPWRPLRVRNGSEDVQVFDFQLTNEQGSSQTLDFKTSMNLWRVLGVAGALVLLSLIYLWLTSSSSAPLYILSVLIFFVLSLVYFDRSIWSTKYFDAQNLGTIPDTPAAMIFNAKMSATVEDYRRQFFDPRFERVPRKETNSAQDEKIWFEPFEKINSQDIAFSPDEIQFIGRDGVARFLNSQSHEGVPLSKKSEKRVVFLGGSQTWGAGASSMNLTWPSQFIQKMNTQIGIPSVGLNFATCGDKVQQLVSKINSVLLARPDLVIINLGSNDINTSEARFRQDLKLVLNLLKEAKVPTLLGIEANGIEDSPTEILKAGLIRETGREMGFEVMDLYPEINSARVRDSGLLWHDYVHLTDFGQSQLARIFIESHVVQAWILEQKKRSK